MAENEKSKWAPYLPALLGVLGVMLGATVTHVGTRSRLLEEQNLKMRAGAYADFLRGQSLLWQAPDKEQEANVLITNAKLSILLTGSKDVLCSMATYWASDPAIENCPDPERRKQDAVIYQQMRRESFHSFDRSESPEVEAAVLVPYLWSCRLPDGDPELKRACPDPLKGLPQNPSG